VPFTLDNNFGISLSLVKMAAFCNAEMLEARRFMVSFKGGMDDANIG